MTVFRSEDRWAEEFASIYDGHRPRLVRWLTSMFGARDAEDIAQETLARLYARPGLLAEDADAWPWLAVVARNVGRDLARHNAFASPVDTATLDVAADQPTPHDAVVAGEDAERLHRALRNVSPRDRTLLLLREVEGLSVADIAAHVGLADNVVRQQLFRARRRLADVYLSLGGDRLAGVVTAVGARARETSRRYGGYLEQLVPGPGALASAAAPVAAAVGGALLLGTPEAAPATAAPAPDAAVAAAPAPVALPSPDDLVDAARGLVAVRLGVLHELPDPGRVGWRDYAKVVHVGADVGAAEVDVWFGNPLTEDGRGRTGHPHVEVDLPVAGPVGVTWNDYAFGESERERRGGSSCPAAGSPAGTP